MSKTTVWSRSGIGKYRANEQHVEILPPNWQGTGTVCGIIALHGAGGDYTAPWQRPFRRGYYDWVRALALAGFPVLSIDAGRPDVATGTTSGPQAWLNDNAQAAVSDAVTYLQSTVGASEGKVGLIGPSMGGGTALAWAGNNPTLAAFVIANSPVADLEDMASNDRGGVAANLNAAYGGTYDEGTHGATHNPLTIATAGGLDDVPVLLNYGTADTITVPATVEALATAIGSNATAYSHDTAHDEPTARALAPSVVVDFALTHAAQAA